MLSSAYTTRRHQVIKLPRRFETLKAWLPQESKWRRDREKEGAKDRKNVSFDAFILLSCRMEEDISSFQSQFCFSIHSLHLSAICFPCSSIRKGIIIQHCVSMETDKKSFTLLNLPFTIMTISKKLYHSRRCYPSNCWFEDSD